MRGRAWTQREIDLLCEHYPTASRSVLRAMFPDRTEDTVRSQASRMGIHKPAYYAKKEGVCVSCGELTRLVQSAHVSGLCSACYLPGYNRQRNKNKGRHQSRKRFWIEAENELMRELYPQGQLEELLQRMPHRSLLAIKHQAHVLRLRLYRNGSLETPSQTDPADRSLEALREAASRRKIRRILPEIEDLCRAERRILQQLDALRQHQQQHQEGTHHAKRSISNRETV